jgi:hypothetical protein
MSARENPGFLSTPRSKIIAATLVAAGIGAAIVYSKNSAAAAATAAAGGAAAGTTTSGSSAALLFNLVYPASATVTPANATADLTAAGFTGIVLQTDPTVPDSFIVAATYPSTGSLTAAITAAVTSTTAPAVTMPSPSAGAGVTATLANLEPIQSVPVGLTTQFAVGTWYSFSVSTSFLQGASGAQADVISLLQEMGFGATETAMTPTLLFVTPVTQSSAGVAIPTTTSTGASNAQAFDTWNVIAQYTGPASPAATAGATQNVSDLPPLLMFKPGTIVSLGTTAPASSTPSAVMP